VFRLEDGGETLYLRLAETAEPSALAPERAAHEALHALGAKVPRVVRYEPRDATLGRSFMVTTEVPGMPLSWSDAAGPAILRAAGRDLALIGSVPVAGWGWIMRDRGEAPDLAAEHATYRAYALEELDAKLAAAAPLLGGQAAEVALALGHFDAHLGRRGSCLAHGDYDATHIFHADAAYSGIIDLGEIRGADVLYDLAHFALHEGEHVPPGSSEHVLAGYREVAALPDDLPAALPLQAVVIGVDTLARVAGRPGAETYAGFLAGAISRQLARFAAS
jgi:Ser/Thr protein kinase RdoA (MazF antagonist)